MSRSIETVHVTVTIERPLTSQPRWLVRHVPCCAAAFRNNDLVGLELAPGSFEPVDLVTEEIARAFAPEPPAEQATPFNRSLADLLDSMPKIFASTTLPTLDELSEAYAAWMLKLVDGNRSKAARMLGVDRRTIYRKYITPKADR